MNMDTLSLIVKSSVDKAKNSVKTMINTFQQYSNVLDKTKQSMQGVANATNTTDSNFNKSKKNIDDLTKKLEKMKNAYKLHQKAFNQRPSGTDSAQPFYKGSDWITDTTSSELITQKSLNEEKAKINELEKELKELRGESDKPITPKVIVPKDSAQGLRNIGKEANDSRKKINLLSVSMSKIGGIARSVGSKGFDFLKNKFKDFSKGFSKSVDGNIKEIRKLALGLIGVRTAMSVLTKSVNAYLSFDSELQDSLTNSWNMLGSLLAPAIEFVARMFAIATNYIAQFVNALTGINLVARANAKSLQTQAKATKGVGEAQRGLLGMDEITNLPTEPGGGGGADAPQIQMDDTIKSFKALDDILQHLKDGQWHLVGEDIAHAIDDMLGKINWKSLKQKAYKFGYNFGDFLNGLFEVNWSQIGTTIAESFNTFVQLIKGFVEKFSFLQFAGGLARMINRAFLDIDWDELASTINTGISKIGSAISLFLSTFEWGDIGMKFGEFVASIDWGNLLFTAVKNSILLLKGVAEFIISFFVGVLDKVFPSLGEKIVSFGDWIINSTLGTIQGISNFIISGINFVKIQLSNFAKAIASIFSGVKDVGKNIGKGFANGFISSVNWLISGLNNIIKPIADILQSVSSATGVNINFKGARIPKIPLLETGTPNIETEGLYHLHEGEMVVPKRYNPNTDGYNNGSDNREIIDLLVSLNASMLEYAERPININMDSRKVAEATYDDMQQIDRNRNKSTAVVRS